jgi:hypothetical protein
MSPVDSNEFHKKQVEEFAEECRTETKLEDNKAPSNLFYDSLYALNLTRSQIDLVHAAIGLICKHCWDSRSGCQCWNDE